MANVALDLLGQARLLLTHAGQVEGDGRDEDQLAFLRDVPEFRNCTLAELPRAASPPPRAASGDYAVTIVRNLLFSAYQCELWRALSGSTDGELAAIAAKSLKEARYHLRHAADWTIRLGDGTDESHARMQAALDALWPYTAELFETDPRRAAPSRVTASASRARRLRADWLDDVAAVLAEATLRLPAPIARSAAPASRACTASTSATCSTEMQSLHRASGSDAGDRHAAWQPRSGASSAARVRAWEALASVPDPEIPVVSIVELGIVRDVRVDGDARRSDRHADLLRLPGDRGHRRVDPAARSRRAGFARDASRTALAPRVDHRLDRPRRARASSRASASRRRPARAGRDRVAASACSAPRADGCRAARTAAAATPSAWREFGSTACKALYRCRDCREPFDYFKPI